MQIHSRFLGLLVLITTKNLLTLGIPAFALDPHCGRDWQSRLFVCICTQKIDWSGDTRLNVHSPIQRYQILSFYIHRLVCCLPNHLPIHLCHLLSYLRLAHTGLDMFSCVKQM
ncbi:unnamed protein product [Orchesella dallaii]|uniref:Secreted protein n=1 Tax=Orchesella dallaii TaxID=48710 RepID=A0ABP1S3H0_9HEXA